MTELLSTAPDDERLLALLRDGDQDAFAELVDRWSPAMLRVARAHVPSRAIAEEVVQEAWLGVLRGLDRFEGRSSLRTWVFRIVLNRARTRGDRERRTVPFAVLAAHEAAEPFAAVDPDRFLPAQDEQWPHHWSTPPRRWEDSPERSLDHAETMAVLRGALATLPVVQRLVVIMRDMEGWPSDEVCRVLDISQGNQRVLLHRARSRMRAALEAQLT